MKAKQISNGFEFLQRLTQKSVEKAFNLLSGFNLFIRTAFNNLYGISIY